MSNADRVREITYRMADKDFDLELVVEDFTDDFQHHANGQTTDKDGYLQRGREYRESFESIDRPQFDELIEVEDRVVVAHNLTLHRRDDGGEQRLAVMAIWTLRDGEVSALREVDAEI
jgi:ketosteroid isomerase-like protein